MIPKLQEVIKEIESCAEYCKSKNPKQDFGDVIFEKRLAYLHWEGMKAILEFYRNSTNEFLYLDMRLCLNSMNELNKKIRLAEIDWEELRCKS